MTAAAPVDFNALLTLEGIDPVSPLGKVAQSVYRQESRSGTYPRANIENYAGALGPMQVIQETFDRMADKGWSRNDPVHNTRAGIRYLKHLDKLSGGDPRLTAAGYYGGEGGLEAARRGEARYDRRPQGKNAPSTLQYADQVVGRIGSMGEWGRGAAGHSAGVLPTVFRSDRLSPADGSPSAAAKPLQASPWLTDWNNVGPAAGATAPPFDAPDPIDAADPADPADWGQIAPLPVALAQAKGAGNWGDDGGFRPVSLRSHRGPRGQRGQHELLRALSAYA